MASIMMQSVKKTYSNGKTVMDNFDIQIKEGSFTVFVGPSGCGKTTAIRIISGLEGVNAGKVFIGEEDVTMKAPGDRGISMVFQNYALYPHMTVEKNISFGLKNYGYSKSEITKTVNAVLELVELKEYRNAKPGQLSGGQRQRVALARAISKNPKVFLMDEPLSNLDAKLRVQMRSELVRIHDRLKSTFVYITHDQVEAMTMGDYIAVMKDGVIMQYDTPKEIYDNPANLFTAKFIGDPGMNIISLRDGNHVGFRSNKIELVMPESFDGITLKTKLSTKERLGSDFNYTILLQDKTELVLRTEDDLPMDKEINLYVQKKNLYAFGKNEERIDIVLLDLSSLEMELLLGDKCA